MLRGLLGLVVALTLLSLLANLLTRPPHQLAPLDGQDVRVGSTRVHLRHWPGTGRPVLLVHGFAESTASWEPMAGLLAAHHDVWAVDLAGYGYTDYDGHYTIDDEVALVDGVIRTIHLQRPVLVGHSLGAAVVGGVAARHPSDVGGVVFADGDALPFDGRQEGPGFARTLLRLPWTTTAYRLVTGWPWLGRRVIGSVCGSTCEGLTPERAEAWMRPMRQGVAEQALPEIAAAGVLHLEVAEIRSIRVPRAIIWGSEDATGGGSLEQTRVNLHHPPERIIDGAGHLSQLARPEAFARAVDELVAAMP